MWRGTLTNPLGRTRRILWIPFLVSCIQISLDEIVLIVPRYGYHVPAVRQRDAFYGKLEEQRAANQLA